MGATIKSSMGAVTVFTLEMRAPGEVRGFASCPLMLSGEAYIYTQAGWPQSPSCHPGQLNKDKAKAPVGQGRHITGPTQSGERAGEGALGSVEGESCPYRPYLCIDGSSTGLTTATALGQGWNHSLASLYPQIFTKLEKLTPKSLQNSPSGPKLYSLYIFL